MPTTYAGTAKFNLDDLEGAVPDFSRAIEIDPERVDAYKNRGLMRFRLGESEFSRGNTKAAQRLYETAIEDYTQAIKLNPEDTETYSKRGAVKSALTAMLGQ